MRTTLTALITGLALGLTPLAAASAEDLLIHGGPIYTGRDDQPQVEALLVRKGDIAYAGPLKAARKMAPEARNIDLDGAAAYPGFVDSHAHLAGIGMRELTLSLEGTPSIEALIVRLKAWAVEHPGKDPVIGRGWIETHWPEGRFPTAADLDLAISDRPVVLTRADGHALVANTAAMARAGITTATQAPSGGQILRTASGAPAGMFVDNAMSLVRAAMPAPSAELKRQAELKGVEVYASRGWTGLHNMAASTEEYAILQDMARAGTLKIRVDTYMSDDDSALVLRTGRSGAPRDMLRLMGVKLFMDGALGSRGAALLAPYSDAEGNGLLLTPPAELARIMTAARQSGAQIAIHAIGDRGNRLALDDFEAAFANNPSALKSARWRVEHAQVLAPEDLPRFAKLGVVASMQPSHAIGDLFFAPSRLGPDRLKGAYAWETLLKSGALVAGGTDAPVEKGDPLVEFYAAAYRHDLTGFAGPNWGLDEAVTRAQALKMFTTGAAQAGFREAEFGTLSVGHPADISVFSVDLMTAPFAEIAKARAVMTVVAGKIAYDGRRP